MDHLLRERLGIGGDDSSEEYGGSIVRDHVRHVEARMLRKVHKPRRGDLRDHYDIEVSEAGPGENC